MERALDVLGGYGFNHYLVSMYANHSAWSGSLPDSTPGHVRRSNPAGTHAHARPRARARAPFPPALLQPAAACGSGAAHRLRRTRRPACYPWPGAGGRGTNAAALETLRGAAKCLTPSWHTCARPQVWWAEENINTPWSTAAGGGGSLNYSALNLRFLRHWDQVLEAADQRGLVIHLMM